MQYHQFTEQQSKIYIDMRSVYLSYLNEVSNYKHYRGSMRWKKSKGHEYLFHAIDRRGNGKSLGRRSIENEIKMLNFNSRKYELKDRLSSLQKQIKEQARYCCAARINRIPNLVTGILRNLEQANLLGNNLSIIGTYSLYAYEVMASSLIDSSLTATGDVDILWDTKTKLKIESDISRDGLLGVLKKIDSSFEKQKNGFKAINKRGFQVDLIKRIPKDEMTNSECLSIGEKDDLEAVEVYSQKWLIASPKIKEVVIGKDGFPALIFAVDPRVYVLHKIWLSQQKERDPLKKKRDHTQAMIVADMIINHLPQYSFDRKQLQMLPDEMINLIKTDQDMPSGFEI